MRDGQYGLTKQQKEFAKSFKTEKEYFSDFYSNERNPLIVIFPVSLPEPKNADKISHDFWEKNKDNVFGHCRWVYQTQI